MFFRSRAPLRIGLAGGGTDVSPYSDIYGGAILNSTINMYAYATIFPRVDNKIILRSIDQGIVQEFQSTDFIQPDGSLNLLKGVYNGIVSLFNKKNLSFTLTTYVDAPAGSGLGTSSTLVVAILGAFIEWLNIPLGEYDIAHLAFEIERNDLAMSGGKQDQYAASFGGVNFMEFGHDDKVIVNPLRVKRQYLDEFQFNLLLYYTGTSRLSSLIIDSQVDNVSKNMSKSIEAMHQLKNQAIMMKEALLKGELGKIGDILDFGWKYKKLMAENISNPIIDEIYEKAKASGASGGKISGAGGGGFMLLYCPGVSKYAVVKELTKFGGEFRRYHFVEEGLTTWRGQ